MTWIEKGRKEHPGVSDEYIMQTYCPEDKEKSMLCFGNDEAECRACWMRPMEPDAPDRT